MWTEWIKRNNQSPGQVDLQTFEICVFCLKEPCVARERGRNIYSPRNCLPWMVQIEGSLLSKGFFLLLEQKLRLFRCNIFSLKKKYCMEDAVNGPLLYFSACACVIFFLVFWFFLAFFPGLKLQSLVHIQFFGLLNFMLYFWWRYLLWCKVVLLNDAQKKYEGFTESPNVYTRGRYSVQSNFCLLELVLYFWMWNIFFSLDFFGFGFRAFLSLEIFSVSCGWKENTTCDQRVYLKPFSAFNVH